MRILSSNIRAIRGATEERLSDIARRLGSLHTDIILLQEVSNESRFVPKIKSRLQEANYENVYFSADEWNNEKCYGNVIATNGPLKILEYECFPNAPWPQLLARACVDRGY